MSKPLFVVSGCTGAQGGSVVRSLLKTNKFRIRGITRDLECKECKDLKQKGVEMVKADFCNKEEVRKALQGADVFFLLTDFWDPSQKGKEFEIGKHLVDIAKELNIKHLILSTLPHVERISKGKYKVPHFTDKAKLAEYALNQGIPVTMISPAFYYQNFQTFLPPKDENGTLVFTFPKSSTITAFDVNDIGDAVVNVAENRDQWLGKFIPLTGSHMSPDEYIGTLRQMTGRKIKLNLLPIDEFARLGFDGAEEFAQMFGWFDEYTFFGPEVDRNLGKKVHPNLKTWQQWLQDTKWLKEGASA